MYIQSPCPTVHTSPAVLMASDHLFSACLYACCVLAAVALRDPAHGEEPGLMALYWILDCLTVVLTTLQVAEVSFMCAQTEFTVGEQLPKSFTPGSQSCGTTIPQSSSQAPS